MKVRRILQIAWRGLVAIPLVASSWAPGWAHPISEALTAAGASPRIDSTQTHTSTPDSEDLPCHGVPSTDVGQNPPVTPEHGAVDDSDGCADDCCPAPHCPPAACISCAAAWIAIGVLDAPAMVNTETDYDWHAPVPPRPPPAEQLRPPIV